MHIRAEAWLPKECCGEFEGDEAPHPINRVSIAAPQAIAGLQKQAPHAMNPDLLCHIGVLPRGRLPLADRRILEDLMKTFALSVRRFLGFGRWPHRG